MLTTVGWRASQILSSETVAGDQVLTLHSLKLCASQQLQSVSDPDPKVNNQIKTILEGTVQNVWWTKNTISKSISDLLTQVDKPDWSKGSDCWGREEFQGGTFVRVDFVPSSTKSVECLPEALSLNYLLVASLRRIKIATGAYLKLSPILRGLTVTTFACLGGGFGGMTSSILRTFPKPTGMVNSQLELTGYHPQGVAPGLPAALDAMPKTVSSRCTNPSTSWEAKTDLTEKETRKQMGDVFGKEGKKVNLIILDCEFRTQENEDAIIENLISFTNDSLTMGGTIIFKTFWKWLVGECGPLSFIGPLFETVEAVFPDYTGTNSSELNLRFSNKMTTDFQLAPDLPSLWKVHEEVKAFLSPG